MASLYDYELQNALRVMKEQMMLDILKLFGRGIAIVASIDPITLRLGGTSNTNIIPSSAIYLSEAFYPRKCKIDALRLPMKFKFGNEHLQDNEGKQGGDGQQRYLYKTGEHGWRTELNTIPVQIDVPPPVGAVLDEVAPHDHEIRMILDFEDIDVKYAFDAKDNDDDITEDVNYGKDEDKISWKTGLKDNSYGKFENNDGEKVNRDAFIILRPYPKLAIGDSVEIEFMPQTDGSMQYLIVRRIHSQIDSSNEVPTETIITRE